MMNQPTKPIESIDNEKTENTERPDLSSRDKFAMAGMPEIAKTNSKKNPIVVVGGIVIVFIIMMFFYPKHDKKTDTTTTEENYSVQAENQKSPSSNTPVQQPEAQLSPADQEAKLALIRAKQKALQERLSAPIMMVNNQSAGSSATKPVSAVASTEDPNTQFMNQVASKGVDTARATTIGPLNYLIAEGSLIQAVLETAINSDLPGYLRAIVSKPIYSEDGSQVLIPKGSRLIGEYRSGLLQGQARVFVVWTRLIIQGGISIQLGSAGVDRLGVAGVGADAIDRHFWERFGTAVLLSILGAGSANIGVNKNDQYNSAQAYRTAVADSFSQSARQSLQQSGIIAPTLTVDQGKPVMVFVARDLNFQEAMRSVKPKLNVF